MLSAPGFTKRRLVLHPGAWRLLREKACADYARRVAPAQVGAMQVLFPKAVVHLGLYVSVQTEAIEGEALLPLLYRPELAETVVDLGLIALEALYTADTGGARGSLFSTVYRYGKSSRIAFQTWAGASGLSGDERRVLLRLLRCYLNHANRRRVLVHGDLHASHILVNRQSGTVGFIDLEALHVGNPATNFAQLWTAYHYADSALGRQFYQSHRQRFPQFDTPCFDSDTRIEVVFRAHSNVQEAKLQRNAELEHKGRLLVHGMLKDATFEEMCMGGKLE